MKKVMAIWYGDDLAYTESMIVSPQVYRKYLLALDGRTGRHRPCRRACRSSIHSDGRLWDVIPDLIALGVNALHPIEPKAMDINEVKARYGRKLALIGNIDMDILPRGTPAEVEATGAAAHQGPCARRRIRGGREPRRHVLRVAAELQRPAGGGFRVWKVPHYALSRAAARKQSGLTEGERDVPGISVSGGVACRRRFVRKTTFEH